VKYIDEYRNEKIAKAFSSKIYQIITQNWVIMEVCGGQTHTILKYGLEELLPTELTIVHGPGCPVCVTPLSMIDKAISIAQKPEVIFTTFGDMMRVPGSELDLLSIKAMGGDVRMVYSPLDTIRFAEESPHKKVVFFAIGFETTAPANAMAVKEAKRKGIKNFSILCSHVLVPPAINAILSSGNSRVQAFLAAGHVCTVMGYEEYIPISQKYKVPIIVTGFEPVDILEGIYMAVKQLEAHEYKVENQYKRVVKKEGNIVAKNIMEEVFTVVDRNWRGIGKIPLSGLKLNVKYAEFDAENIFEVKSISTEESQQCIAGEVLQGLKKPVQCELYGKQCNPEHPVGAPMVSSEGACAAYFHYSKQ